jgi:RHS repeat-associated protein
VGLTNAAGTLVERYTYSAYGTLGIYAANGTVRSSSSTYANRYTYTGREYDPDLNLYHFRARWYDPATGGFISRDPLGYVDGMSLYRGYFGVQELDPFGLWRSDDDWLWPWDSRASWDPETTIGTWVAGGEYACSGAANFILTGDSEASEEILNAATEGWIKGFGLNPFDTTQSLGQLVYTDQLSTSTEIIQAAIARSQVSVREEWDCYKSCMWEINRSIPYVACGITGVIPFVTTPKWLTWPFLPKASYLGYVSTTRWAMNYTHLLVMLKENMLMSEKAYKRWRAYQDYWKRWQLIKDIRLQRLQLTYQFGCKAVKGIFVAEMLLSTYCSAACYFRERD